MHTPCKKFTVPLLSKYCKKSFHDNILGIVKKIEL